MKWVALPLLLMVAFLMMACSTAQVTESCGETREIAQRVRDFPGFALAPIEVRAAAMILQGASTVCSTPEYARARNVVMAWLQSKLNR